MKQKTVRFGGYWLKVYKFTGDLRIVGGLSKFRETPKRQTTNMLGSSDSQLEKISEFGRAVTRIADDLLLQRQKRRKWWAEK